MKSILVRELKEMGFRKIQGKAEIGRASCRERV